MTCSIHLLSNFVWWIWIAVLNFFATPSEDECKSEDGLRSGVCMNVYDCHQKGGTAKGQCALGFGACCVCKWFLERKCSIFSANDDMCLMMKTMLQLMKINSVFAFILNSYFNMRSRNQEQHHILHIAQLSGSHVNHHQKLQAQD